MSVSRGAYERKDGGGEEHKRRGDECTKNDADGHLLDFDAVLGGDDEDRGRRRESAIKETESRQLSVVGEKIGSRFLPSGKEYDCFFVMRFVFSCGHATL